MPFESPIKRLSRRFSGTVADKTTNENQVKTGDKKDSIGRGKPGIDKASESIGTKKASTKSDGGDKKTKKKLSGPTPGPSSVLEQKLIVYSSTDNDTFYAPQGYEMAAVMGSGAYGTVCSATVKSMGVAVALKRYQDPLSHLLYAKRTLRELRFLRFTRHENVIQVRAVYCTGPTVNDIGDIYAVTDLMDTDLSYIIRSGQPVTQAHVKFFIYQILRGLKYLHSLGIIHRDLKPKNVLVTKTCDVKICDLGLARLDNRVLTRPGDLAVTMTEYVCTRWYRAPEILCCWPEYSFAVDIWAVGCILGELVLRVTVFKGASTVDQLRQIRLKLGSPTDDELGWVPNKKARDFLRGQEHVDPPNFNEVFPGQDSDLVDMLRKVLQFHPGNRPTAAAALAHPFVAELHDEDDEPSGTPLSRSLFSFERKRLTIDSLRELLLDEILNYHPKMAGRLQVSKDPLAHLEELSEDEFVQLELEDSKEEDTFDEGAKERAEAMLRHGFT